MADALIETTAFHCFQGPSATGPLEAPMKRNGVHGPLCDTLRMQVSDIHLTEVICPSQSSSVGLPRMEVQHVLVVAVLHAKKFVRQAGMGQPLMPTP
jgi:hypothetical protein